MGQPCPALLSCKTNSSILSTSSLHNTVAPRIMYCMLWRKVIRQSRRGKQKHFYLPHHTPPGHQQASPNLCQLFRLCKSKEPRGVCVRLGKGDNLWCQPLPPKSCPSQLQFSSLSTTTSANLPILAQAVESHSVCVCGGLLGNRRLFFLAPLS